MTNKIIIEIENNVPQDVAIQCVSRVIADGRISNDGKNYCYATDFTTKIGEVCVYVRPNSKNDSFIVKKIERI